MSKFKVGDKVKIGKNIIGAVEGTVFTVKPYKEFNGVWVDVERKIVCENYVNRGYGAGFADFTYAEDIAKPILEDRKIGKVKMQLFDEGFPNAVMEIAKVMSWAEQNKGYRPNDFKNLPNADVEFSAAASRHKLKGLIQKDAGLPPLERVDEESGIVHLAHAAFNILAELELVLTGRIKE